MLLLAYLKDIPYICSK